jgi:hypothetical protein
MSEIIYCSYEGRPTVYLGGGVAYWFYDGQWHEAPGAEVFDNAKTMSKKAFARRFGDLPNWPSK